MAKGRVNSFELIGYIQSEFIQEKDKHGNTNHSLVLKTDNQYPVTLRVHFYSLKKETLEMTYKGRKVSIVGSIQGTLYENRERNGEIKEWLQLRGASIKIINEETGETVDDMEQTVYDENDLPF